MPSDMCFFTWETCIPSDICSPTCETHIPSDMCFLTWETRIPSDICSPTWEIRIPSDMCSPTCVPLPKTFLTNLVFIFWLLFLFSHDQNRESSSTVHFSPKPQQKRLLRSKGFYYQILGAVTVLKFLQTLALDFLHICLQFFPGKFLQANV